MPNANDADLKESYGIAQKVKAYSAEHPDQHIYRM